MAKADSEFITGAPVALPEHERQTIAAEIQAHLDAAETLIAKLDATEPDCDLEPYLAGWQPGMDDREQDVGDEGEKGADDDLSCDDLDAGGHPRCL